MSPRMPAGAEPGTTHFASAPTMNPKMTQERIDMPASLSALLAGLLLLSPVAASAADPTEISVTGTGSVGVAPDEVMVNGVVQTRDENSATSAAGRNSATYNGIVAGLIALGVPRNDISSSAYIFNYTARPASPNPYLQWGYTVTRSFSVRVHDPSMAGKVVDAVAAAGATQINGVSFTLSNPRVAVNEATELALQDAAQKAASIASSEHLHIIGIESITTSGAAIPPQLGMPLQHIVPTAPTTLDNAATTISETVSVVYLAKP